MESDINKTIDAAIDKMAEQAKAQVDSQRALHFSQSALNLAQTKSVLHGSRASSAESLANRKTT